MSIERIPITSREQWLAARRQDVTASDIAALFGKSPYKTMLSMFAEKSGLVGDLTEENDAMRRGRYLEHAILAACAEHPSFAGKSVAAAGEYWRDTEQRIGATPDAYVNGVEPLDAKSVATYVFDKEWDQGPPLHIQLQVLTQAMLMNAPRGWVACGVMSAEFPVHVFEAPRHAGVEAMILKEVAAFWRAVEAGEAPEPKAGDHATLQALYPREVKPEPLDWSDNEDLQRLLLRRAEIAEITRPLEGEKTEIDAKIKAAMGAHALALAPGWKVTWKERAAYTANVSASRVLRVTALNAEKEEAA